MSPEAAVVACQIINKYIIDDPLDEDEMNTILRVDESRDVVQIDQKEIDSEFL